ncbi:hypothetical protein D210916BOD24_19520 [Alteromonas sp. D210916BOD_24]|uniref:bifunctional diguanylate cyclase/phosphodiesterase n=1 Tax=Alteromonas sp. D210916BOD_24 TaxID=3157618 RepID=UPI00399D3A6D
MELRSDRMLSIMRTTSQDYIKHLDNGKSKVNALCMIMTSINPYTGSATVLCADSQHPELESNVIYCPSHVRLMLPMTPMSAPIPAQDFKLPAVLAHLADTYVVVASINNLQDQLEGVLFCFMTHASLSAQQHAFLEITRQRIEIGMQYQLVQHPYSEKLTAQLTLLEEVSALSKVGAWEVDRYSGLLSVTSVVKSILGLEHLQEIYVHQVLDLLDETTRKKLSSTMLNALKKDNTLVEFIQFRNGNGRYKSVKLTVHMQRAAESTGSGKIVRFYGAVQDETDVQTLSDSQHNFTEYVTSLLNHVNGVVLSVDKDGTILTVNNQVEGMLGFKPEELIGQDIKLVATPEAFDHNVSILSQLCGIPFNERASEASCEPVRNKSGKHTPCEVSVKRCTLHNQALSIVTLRDITDQLHEIEHYKRLAFRDATTGLFNTCFLEHHIKSLAAPSADMGKITACLRLSIDNMKEYEHAFGLPTVDYILRIIARRFERGFAPDEQKTHLICKAQDHAFYLFFQSLFENEDQANEAIDATYRQLQKHVLLPINLYNHSLDVHTQIVSCTLPMKHLSFKHLKSVLDKVVALPCYRQATTNASLPVWRVHQRDVDRYHSILHALNCTVSDNEFYVQLQPQYDTNQTIINSEVLLRWRHPQLGELSPSEFIPIAEESEVIAELDLWVSNEACKLLSECIRDNVSTKLSINISAKHLARADFVKRFVTIVNRWHVPHHLITVELTESALIHGVCTVQQRVRELAESGFNLSIDDFGIGESNLNYLQSLPISELKVDRLFVEGIESSQQKRCLVKSICHLASNMALNTVAEGIENTTQLDYAKDCGCTAFQGFYLDKPLSIDSWKQKLSAMH